MEEIEKYFKEKTQEIGFIELRDGANIGLGSYTIENIPLPIVTHRLIKEIEEGQTADEIDLGNIIEGIIYIMGADPDFPYIDDYRKILLAYRPDIEDYILDNAARRFQKGDLDISGLWLRSLLAIEDENLDGIFNYGLVLEEIGKELMSKGDEKRANEFIKASSMEFEGLLDLDEKYSLSYYKLGFHYKHFERYMKAGLIWNKFLAISEDDILKEEIREEIELIKDDAYFETGLTYLNFNDYDKALEAFLKLLPKHRDSWNVNFLIGQSYMALNQYDQAAEYMERAIDLNEEETDIYNELGIIYFNIGDINKAVDVFRRGIENCQEDYKLYFNRGLGYIEMGLYDLALKDIDKAHKLNPDNPNIKEQKSLLEGHI